MSESIPPDRGIEQVLRYMGVRRGNNREIGYQHFHDFVHILKQHSGEDEERILNLARSYVGVDRRYLKQYLGACLEWGTATARDGKLQFVGVPKGEKVAKGKAFTAYEEPPEK
jgi:hypothetical protein